jgi:hypothetical protein
MPFPWPAGGDVDQFLDGLSRRWKIVVAVMFVAMLAGTWYLGAWTEDHEKPDPPIVITGERPPSPSR